MMISYVCNAKCEDCQASGVWWGGVGVVHWLAAAGLVGGIHPHQ